jgi:hypothetical protein
MSPAPHPVSLYLSHLFQVEFASIKKCTIQGQQVYRFSDSISLAVISLMDNLYFLRI